MKVDQSEVHGYSCFCGSTIFKKFGFLRNGRQRISCCNCGSTKVIGPRPAYKVDERKKAIESLLAGASVRQAASASALSRRTIQIIRNGIKNDLPALCQCGDMAGHRGWCSYRYAKSPARQAFMQSIIRRPVNPHALRPGAFFLGFLAHVSFPASLIPKIRRCESKSCIFPATFFEDGRHLCRYHVAFFNFPLSMTDSGLEWEDIHDSEENDAPLSIIEPWNDYIYFEHKGVRIYENREVEI